MATGAARHRAQEKAAATGGLHQYIGEFFRNLFVDELWLWQAPPKLAPTGTNKNSGNIPGVKRTGSDGFWCEKNRFPADAAGNGAGGGKEKNIEGGSMTWIFADQRWEQVRERVRENWDGLTEPDLDWVSGSRDRLHACLCRVYGISCRLADAEISRFETLYSEVFLRPGRKCLSKRICLRFSMCRPV